MHPPREPRSRRPHRSHQLERRHGPRSGRDLVEYRDRIAVSDAKRFADVEPQRRERHAGSITDNSSANNFSPVSLTANWNLTAGTTVDLVGWFSTPAQALVNGTDFIPSSKLEGRIGVAAFAPFSNGPTGGVGVANGSLILFSQPVAAGSYLGTRTDQLDLRLNLAGTSTVAGTIRAR